MADYTAYMTLSKEQVTALGGGDHAKGLEICKAIQAQLDSNRTYRITHDELETIRRLILDWGFEYGLTADEGKVDALAKKIGVVGDCYGKDQE